MAFKDQSNVSKNIETCPVCGKSLPKPFPQNCPFCGTQLYSNVEIISMRLKSVPVKKIPDSDFFLGETLVTQKQYQEIMGENPSHFRGNDDLPVENVSWNDAIAFCEKLTARERENGTLPEGYKYFLPSCEQWEKAVAGTIDVNSCVWFSKNSCEKTHSVKSKEPTACGIYDLLGNVWEWCADSGKNPFLHFCRGGSWNCSEKLCSPSFSVQASAEYRSNDLGFRVALVPEETGVPVNTSLDLEGNFVEPKKISYLNYPAPEEKQIAMLKVPGQDFLLGKYPITQGEYKKVMGENPSQFRGRGNTNCPVENVSWTDAMAFCKKLTKLERARHILPNNYKYTLPTSEQWEIACRAGSKSRYYFGHSDENLQLYAWYKYNSDKKTHPVSQKFPNPWGFYDVYGNVNEWTSTMTFDERASGKASLEAKYIFRGGGWGNDNTTCTSEKVYKASPTSKQNDLGFRIAIVPENTGVPVNTSLGLDKKNHLAPEEKQIAMLKVPGQNFLLGKYPITQGEYKKIMGKNPSYFHGNENLPVENVSWDEALEFCEKLTELEHTKRILPDNYEYTLPTSEQWEIACRAGTKTRYYFGDSDEDLDSYAWYKHNSDRKTHPVDQKNPNDWGFYDMCGNVREWTLTQNRYGTKHICRGGSWKDGSDACTSGKVGENDFRGSLSDLGFRIALVSKTGKEIDQGFIGRRTQILSQETFESNENQVEKSITDKGIDQDFIERRTQIFSQSTNKSSTF